MTQKDCHVLTNFQIFVHSLSGTPGRWQISTSNGFMSRWTRGGRELLFEQGDRKLMAVDIDTRDGFRPGTPHQLFTLPAQSPGGGKSTWGCAAQGEHFYLFVPSARRNAGTIEVVSGFHSLVNRK